MSGCDKLTKYECSRIIGLRIAQLSMSAPILVDIPLHKQSDFLFVAATELKHRALDVVVRRTLPHNEYYDVSAATLDVPDDVDAIIGMRRL